MDISKDLLGSCSPYIHTYIYDIDDRSLIIEFIGNINKPKPERRLVFTEISSFSEHNELGEFDDENLDDLVDISRILIDGVQTFVVASYKKTITIASEAEPFAEAI